MATASRGRAAAFRGGGRSPQPVCCVPSSGGDTRVPRLTGLLRLLFARRRGTLQLPPGRLLNRGVMPMERKKASDFPAEVLTLFDGYVHGMIGRREFLDGAAKFAVGGVSAAAMLESLRPNFAFAQQIPKDDARIKTEYLTYPSPQGSGTMRGYYAQPAKPEGKLPGVVVI